MSNYLRLTSYARGGAYQISTNFKNVRGEKLLGGLAFWQAIIANSLLELNYLDVAFRRIRRTEIDRHTPWTGITSHPGRPWSLHVLEVPRRQFAIGIWCVSQVIPYGTPVVEQREAEQASCEGIFSQMGHIIRYGVPMSVRPIGLGQPSYSLKTIPGGKEEARDIFGRILYGTIL